MTFLYFVDPVEHKSYPKCMVNKITDWDCPGCGSSRGARYFVHLDFAKAFQSNPLSFFALPLIWTYFLLLSFGFNVDEFVRKFIPLKVYSKIGYFILSLIIIFFVFRNLIW